MEELYEECEASPSTTCAKQRQAISFGSKFCFRDSAMYPCIFCMETRLNAGRQLRKELLRGTLWRTCLLHTDALRADFWNYQKSGVSREISNSFIFCPYNPCSGVFSKITFKVSSACYFFQNRAKFEIRQISVLSVTKLTENYPFSSRS